MGFMLFCGCLYRNITSWSEAGLVSHISVCTPTCMGALWRMIALLLSEGNVVTFIMHANKLYFEYF